MQAANPVRHRVSPLVEQRHSPRAFAERDVEDATLRSLLEAARWAPSSFNEQPWRFVVVRRDDPIHEDAAELLSRGNQRWAPDAPVLLFAIARDTFAGSGKPNPHAGHDVGQALAWLTVEATHRGLVVHQMAGFDSDEARALFDVPEGYTPLTAVAIGWPGDAADLPDDLEDKEHAERQRHAQVRFVFRGRFGVPLLS